MLRHSYASSLCLFYCIPGRSAGMQRVHLDDGSLVCRSESALSIASCMLGVRRRLGRVSRMSSTLEFRYSTYFP